MLFNTDELNKKKENRIITQVAAFEVHNLWKTLNQITSWVCALWNDANVSFAKKNLSGF